MELTSYVATSYLGAQQRSLDVTAANLANAGTAGFKAERVLFSDWLSRQTGTDGSHGLGSVAFVQDRATYRDIAPGTLQHTGNPLDLAITAGWLLHRADAPRYPASPVPAVSRRSRTAPSPTTPATRCSTRPASRCVYRPPTPASPSPRTVPSPARTGSSAAYGVVQPADPRRMQGEGGTTLRAEGTPAPVDDPKVVQGVIEDSNVQPILEMTRMMSGLRSFEFTAQLLQKESDRMQSAIDKLTAARS